MTRNLFMTHINNLFSKLNKGLEVTSLFEKLGRAEIRICSNKDKYVKQGIISQKISLLAQNSPIAARNLWLYSCTCLSTPPWQTPTPLTLVEIPPSCPKMSLYTSSWTCTRGTFHFVSPFMPTALDYVPVNTIQLNGNRKPKEWKDIYYTFLTFYFFLQKAIHKWIFDILWTIS